MHTNLLFETQKEETMQNPWCRWEDNIKMLLAIECEDVN
jgi:hypothetical protein